MSANKLPNINQLSVIARKIYESIDPAILKNNEGRYIAIELDSKEFFFDDSKDKAVQLAKEKYPKKLIFTRRIGEIEKLQASRNINLNSGIARTPLKLYARVF